MLQVRKFCYYVFNIWVIIVTSDDILFLTLPFIDAHKVKMCVTFCHACFLLFISVSRFLSLLHGTPCIKPLPLALFLDLLTKGRFAQRTLAWILIGGVGLIGSDMRIGDYDTQTIILNIIFLSPCQNGCQTVGGILKAQGLKRRALKHF